MEFFISIIVFVALVAFGFFWVIIRGGVKLDEQRRAKNNQDIADRINAGR